MIESNKELEQIKSEMEEIPEDARRNQRKYSIL